DEARGAVEFARLPGQVERINGNAVSAKSGAGIEGHEAERLCLCRVDDFPNINAHAVKNDLEFVDHGDVDGAEDVLHQLRGLGHLAIGDGDDFRNNGGVQCDG